MANLQFWIILSRHACQKQTKRTNQKPDGPDVCVVAPRLQTRSTAAFKNRSWKTQQADSAAADSRRYEADGERDKGFHITLSQRAPAEIYHAMKSCPYCTAPYLGHPSAHCALTHQEYSAPVTVEHRSMSSHPEMSPSSSSGSSSNTTVPLLQARVQKSWSPFDTLGAFMTAEIAHSSPVIMTHWW